MPVSLSTLAFLSALGGCSLRAGPVPLGGLTPAAPTAQVAHAAVVPAVRSEVLLALRRRGVPPGDALALDLAVDEDVAAVGDGSALYAVELVLDARVPTREGCAVSVRGAWPRAYVDGDPDPDALFAAVAALAARTVDALLEEPACTTTP